MAVKVLTLTYKSLSPAVVIFRQYVYAFIWRADAVKTPRRKRRFQWLMSAPAPRWSPPQTSPHHHACTHLSPSLFFSIFQAEGSSVELLACNFTPRGEKKSPIRPVPLSMRQSVTFKCQFCDRICSFSSGLNLKCCNTFQKKLEFLGATAF